MPQSSPLAEIARGAGATFAETAGWELLAHFGDPDAEYRAALEAAALFDISHQGKLEVSGPDAPQFLHNLCTNDVKDLPLGGGCPAYFCDPRAKTLFQAWVYHVRLDGGTRDALWVDVTPGHAEGLLKHLDRYLISEQVELADRTAQFAQMHLAGPRAKEVLERALGEPVPDLEEFQHMERTFGANAVCSIRRRDPLGVPGYDLVCLNARAEGVWRMLTSVGARPAGLEAFEVLRVEAGTPVYGADIDEGRFVMEVGDAKRAVSYSKGCFVGQEPIVMSRDRAGHAPRAFLGLKLRGGRAARRGAKVFRDGNEVGVVTSSVDSPAAGCPIALAYLRRGHQEPGTVLAVEDADGRQEAEVVGLPVR